MSTTSGEHTGTTNVSGFLSYLSDAASIIAYCGYSEEVKLLPFSASSFYTDDDLLIGLKHVQYGPQQRTRLMSACRAGDAHRVSVLLRVHADVKAVDAVKKWSPLHYAAESTNQNLSTIIDMLIKGGAEVDMRGKDKNSARGTEECCTPLMVAARAGHEASCVHLFTHGADVNAKSNSNMTPLLYAASQGHEAASLRLIDLGADVLAKETNNGTTPLTYAAAKGFLALCLRLLEFSHVDVNAKSYSGRTPLACAAMNGYENICLSLLQLHQADVDAADYSQQTPLMEAALRGNETMCLFLLKHGADINRKDRDGNTAFVLAGQKHHIPLCRLFRQQHGANVNTKNEKGMNLLLWACSQGYESLCVFLLEQPGGTGKDVDISNVDVNVTDDFGWSPLFFATANSHTNIAHHLLKHGADVNAKNKHGRTPLMNAAANNAQSLVLQLVDVYGADVNAKSATGRTPLMYAALSDHDAMCVILLERGADVNAKDNDGNTAFELARIKNHHLEKTKVYRNSRLRELVLTKMKGQREVGGFSFGFVGGSSGGSGSRGWTMNSRDSTTTTSPQLCALM